MDKDKVLQAYQKTINEIDDYLEYHYVGKTAEEVRQVILLKLTLLNKRLKELDGREA